MIDNSKSNNQPPLRSNIRYTNKNENWLPFLFSELIDFHPKYKKKNHRKSKRSKENSRTVTFAMRPHSTCDGKRPPSDVY